jgi:hypothetical protein
MIFTRPIVANKDPSAIDFDPWFRRSMGATPRDLPFVALAHGHTGPLNTIVLRGSRQHSFESSAS